MKSNFKHNISFELFGQSHDQEIGITIHNLPIGFVFDAAAIDHQLQKRQGKQSFNTPRQEEINYKIVKGVEYLEDDFIKITKPTIKVVFTNDNYDSSAYENVLEQPRPGHVDFVAHMKYKDKHQIAGGGHFSGRLMAPLVFFGFLCRQILKKDYPHLKVISHIKSFMQIQDISYYELRKQIVNNLNFGNLETYNHIQLQLLARKLYENLHSVLEKGIATNSVMPTFDQGVAQTMYKKVSKLKDDTVGGQVETIIINPPSLLGDPTFASVEAIISQLIYSIPSIKGIIFGNNYRFINKYGSQVKDEIIYIDKHRITTLYNANGGINGGLSNGEDIVYTTTIKPISSIKQNQHTYNLKEKKIMPLKITGQHDVTIMNRIIPIIDAISYIAIYDLVNE